MRVVERYIVNFSCQLRVEAQSRRVFEAGEEDLESDDYKLSRIGVLKLVV